ncbi:MAG: bifunctional ADP-dependent NAD(P)H-hydrate dehydratase/NAD(P)H-hydrate epimerase [Micrococcales bacterium]|nr:bifunctional ADP-dependent NAD(P)H-hydrate dehydratase/NAD(P)H-hydrate epimerase [Micrococcales bacterium]
MIPSFTAAQIEQAEKDLMETVPEGSLMALASHAAANLILRELRARRGKAAGAKVLALVGPGNNGGDTLYAGAKLCLRGVAVTAVATANRMHPAGQAAFEAVGGRVVSLAEPGPGPHMPIEDVTAMALRADCIVDGLLGIGARGPLSGRAAGLVTTLIVEMGLDAPLRYRRPGRPFVVAIDLPSGVSVDDGMVDGQVLPADVTVTFGAYKPAALLPPASSMFGRVELIDIGLTEPLARAEAKATARRFEASDVLATWPVPRRSDHKYTRGVVGMVAGSDTYPGAAVLTTSAAVCAGVGMVRYLGPDKAIERVLSRRPEVVPGGGRVDAWALGPGVAPGAESQLGRIASALEWAKAKRVPAVVDAGGFALLPPSPERLDPWIILTPHAGEMASLLQDRGVSTDRESVEAQPAHHARLAAELVGGTILLKGPATVVSGQDGSCFVQADGPPWLATAGTGDVLTGLIGALLAGHGDSVAITPDLPTHIAALGALVHGRAALKASTGSVDPGSGRLGKPIAAMDVVRALPQTIQELLQQ